MGPAFLVTALVVVTAPVSGTAALLHAGGQQRTFSATFVGLAGKLAASR